MLNVSLLAPILNEMKLLLLSNSTTLGQPYLEWPMDYIDRFMGDIREALFIPYAAVGFSYDEYTEKVGEALEKVGIKVNGIHTKSDPVKAVEEAEAILVGGGNTFHLLKTVQDLQLVEPLRSAVKSGCTYVGWSAGSNLVCPTIKTTNDMPICMPSSFEALNLISYQINPHYTDGTVPGHGGESRMQRLSEYLAINDTPVVCLPENCALRIEGDTTRLLSAEPVKFLTSPGEFETLHHGIVDLPV